MTAIGNSGSIAPAGGMARECRNKNRVLCKEGDAAARRHPGIRIEPNTLLCMQKTVNCGENGNLAKNLRILKLLKFRPHLQSSATPEINPCAYCLFLGRCSAFNVL